MGFIALSFHSSLQCSEYCVVTVVVFFAVNKCQEINKNKSQFL